MDYHQVAQFSETWGLVILLTMFLGGVAYALWPSNKSKFDQAAQLPLNDDAEAQQ